VCAPAGGLTEALAHDPQPSRPLKRKSASMAVPTPAALPPPPNAGAPEVRWPSFVGFSNSNLTGNVAQQPCSR
jgi:hypothetical protein